MNDQPPTEQPTDHPFKPLTFYDAAGENPIQTDWCGHLNGPLSDPDVGVCGQLAAAHPEGNAL